MNNFRRGFKVSVHGPDSWNLDKAADLPANPANVAQAALADPDAPSEGPDIRNNLKKYGGNINRTEATGK